MTLAASAAGIPRISTLDLFPALGVTDRVVSLEQLLASTGQEPLPLAQALHLGAALAQRVAAVHAAGRAVGLLDGDRVRVSAGGQVSLTRTGLGALAPELAQGGSGSSASDIYAVGFLIHRLVTGAAPSLARPVPPSELNPRLDAELDAVLLRALRPAPEERPAVALALQAALEGLAEELGLAADPHGLGRRVERLLAGAPAPRQTFPPTPAAEAWLADPGPLPADAELDAGPSEPRAPGPSPRLLLGAATLALLAVLFTAFAVLRPGAEPRLEPPGPSAVEPRAARAEPPQPVEAPARVGPAAQAPSGAAELRPVGGLATQVAKRPLKRVKVPRRR